MLSDVGGKGLGLPIFIFYLLKKIEFASWPDIIVSQILICYWLEMFLLILTSDSEAIYIDTIDTIELFVG